jgi:nucleotide-binding universal stress UspA family protein
MADAPILICYDGTEDSKRAITTAASLLGSHHPAVVITVAPLVTIAESYASLAPGPAVFEDLNRASAEEQAGAGAELARTAGMDAQARGDLGAPTWDAIVAAADEIGAAVIVIGSRGLTGIKEAVEGSVSHGVAEHAGRPVLIVPPPHQGSSSTR